MKNESINGVMLVGDLRTRLMYRSREAMAVCWKEVYPNQLLPDDHVQVETEKIKIFLESLAKPQRGRSASITNAAVSILEQINTPDVADPIVEKPEVEQLEVVTLQIEQPKLEEGFKHPLSTRIRRAIIDVILFSIVVLHGALVWYDCAILWDVPGQIGGGVVFMVVLAALLLSFDRYLTRTSANIVWFVLILDSSAWKVHFEVFKTPVVDDMITGCVCAFICICSWFALYILRDSKTD